MPILLALGFFLLWMSKKIVIFVFLCNDIVSTYCSPTVSVTVMYVRALTTGVTVLTVM
jgi:hypothetical protein